MKKLVGYVLSKNEESINELNEKIKNGGNKKSIESVICGIRKNNEILRLINDLLEGKNGNEEIIRRLEYSRKIELKEVTKEEVIKNDLIDSVVIKKVGGVNKYFIEVQN